MLHSGAERALHATRAMSVPALTMLGQVHTGGHTSCMSCSSPLSVRYRHTQIWLATQLLRRAGFQRFSADASLIKQTPQEVSQTFRYTRLVYLSMQCNAEWRTDEEVRWELRAAATLLQARRTWTPEMHFVLTWVRFIRFRGYLTFSDCGPSAVLNSDDSRGLWRCVVKMRKREFSERRDPITGRVIRSTPREMEKVTISYSEISSNDS
jgi:hypothetical protein